MMTDALHRLDVKVSVTRDRRRYSGLKLTVRAELHGLLEWLPEHFVADGAATDGSLVLVEDPRGSHQVTYAGHALDDDTKRYDYVQLPTRHVGFEPNGPMLPVTTTLTCSPGLVEFDAVPTRLWLPRSPTNDPRSVRIARLLDDGYTYEQVRNKLPPIDQTALTALIAGASVDDAPPHVRYLYRVGWWSIR